MPGIKAFAAAVFGGHRVDPGRDAGRAGLLGVIEQPGQGVYLHRAGRMRSCSACSVLVLVFKPAGLLGKARQGRRCDGYEAQSKNILRSGFFNADRVTAADRDGGVRRYGCCWCYTGNVGRQHSAIHADARSACNIVLAVSLNLVVGLLGELSLGHAGFMSVGLFTGCTVAVLLQGKLPAAVCLPLCMVIGGLAAALVGLVVGLPALRLGGDYLAIVTLGMRRDYPAAS